MLYSGIDLHKHSLVIHTVAEESTRVREPELATARPVLSAYFATLPLPAIQRAGAGELPDLMEFQVRMVDDEHPLVAAQVKRCERELRPRLLPREDVQRLVGIPGIGAVIAYTLVLEIDDAHRFPTARHLHSHCRPVPGADNSAGTTRRQRSRDEKRALLLHLKEPNCDGYPNGRA